MQNIVQLNDSTAAAAQRPSKPSWLALAALACVLASGSAARAQEVPTEDEDLAFLAENGFQSFIFAQTCVSVGEAGDVIDVEPLPVGGGRHLECETASVGLLQTIDTLSSTGERFCALGQAASIVGDGDPRLLVDVVSIPDGAPWGLVGTTLDGEEISISKVTGFGGGQAFPLWADVIFDVIDIQPNPTAQFCDAVFGL